VNVIDITVWDELSNLHGWSELAARCDASPFSWPGFCLPWWQELGWGRLLSVAVEEAGVLVGLALVHDRVRDFGRPTFSFLVDENDTYHQMLVADDRADVISILWEKLLSSGREIGLCAVPLEIAHRYIATEPLSLALDDHPCAGFVDVPLDGIESPTPVESRLVRKVQSPAECVDFLLRPEESARWGAGLPGSQMAAFFASAVDASVRAGLMSLYLVDHDDRPPDGLLVAHGSNTSAVWRYVGKFGLDTPLARLATTEAANRGSRRLLWPEASGVPGREFPLTNIVRVPRKGSRLREVAGFARSFSALARNESGVRG